MVLLMVQMARKDCRIPVRYLLGQENHGFYYIMMNFQGERLIAGGDAALTELLDEHPHADRQHLRQLHPGQHCRSRSQHAQKQPVLTARRQHCHQHSVRLQPR